MSLSFHPNKAATFRDSILYKYGDPFKKYYARPRVYIKHNLATLSIKLRFVQLLDVALLSMSVFINMYCICVAKVDTKTLMPHPALFPPFYYLLFLHSSVCQVRLAVLPDAFPCIIHKTKSKEKKHLAYFSL